MLRAPYSKPLKPLWLDFYLDRLEFPKFHLILSYVSDIMEHQTYFGKKLDKEDIKQIFNQYYAGLCALARKYLHDTQEAEDVVF